MNVFKRTDGRYEGRIPRGKNQNGKRKFQYILARTKEEVISRINDIRKNEERHDKCSKSITIVFYEWFKSIQYKVKESTQANYKMKADKNILPYFRETLWFLTTTMYILLLPQKNTLFLNRNLSI